MQKIRFLIGLRFLIGFVTKYILKGRSRGRQLKH
jgi:hypothetical protein